MEVFRDKLMGSFGRLSLPAKELLVGMSGGFVEEREWLGCNV
jgi:hypothetical protein